MAEPGLFTLGVEEEFQIVDPKTRELKSHIQQIIEDGKVVKVTGDARFGVFGECSVYLSTGASAGNCLAYSSGVFTFVDSVKR